ncbi:MAG: LysR family transcriptional regulator [Lautropia sp.]
MQPGSVPDLGSRDLQAVCTIAECGSFMAAALTLNVSQPALTRTVQRVESALGVALFRRSTRRVSITPAGQEFIDVANRILADLNISYENMRSISDEQRGRVIVSASMSASYAQMPRLVASYRESRPNIEIQLREGIQGAVLDDVRSGVADLGVTYLDEDDDEFIAIELGSERFYCVMPAHHPLSGKEGVRVDDLANMALVSMPKAAHIRRLLDGLASIARIRLQHAVTVHQFATAMQCVRAGVGISLVPGGAVPAALNEGLVARPFVEPELERAIGILVLKNRSPTPAAGGFIAHLREHWKAGDGAARPAAGCG